MQPLVGIMPDWYDDATCAQADPEDFYPESGSRLAAERAKGVCAECPVRELCLKWAIDTREQWGVWGGLSERERRKLWPTGRRDRVVLSPRRTVSRGRQRKPLTDHGPCGECGKPIRSEEKAQRFCSRSCGAQARERAKREAAA